MDRTRKIGFIGCGKIGKAMAKEAMEMRGTEIVFIQDKAFVNDLGLSCPVTEEADEELYEKTDLIIECATADVLKDHLEKILTHASLMPFSVTAFSDRTLERRAKELCAAYHRNIYIPHGAILGLDGIFDGRRVWDEVTIETVKSPKSLGREDKERITLYEGPAREVCSLFPRNVNVHAAVALAGIGFDKTRSKITADPSVDTNSHRITLKGQGIEISMDISSFAAGAVSGAYTPYSAKGSLRRVLGGGWGIRFV